MFRSDIKVLICDVKVLRCDFKVFVGDVKVFGGYIKVFKGDVKVLRDDTKGFGDDVKRFGGDTKLFGCAVKVCSGFSNGTGTNQGLKATWSTLSFLKDPCRILKLLMASVSCFDEYFTLFRGIVPVTWTADHKHEKCC